MIRRLTQRATLALAALGSAALVLAILVRWTVRDQFPASASFFYATPWPVIAGGAALLSAVWWEQKRRRPSLALALLAMLALAAWIAASWRGHPRLDGRGELRVVLWNVGRPERGLQAIARWLRAQDADIIALPEGHRAGYTSMAQWRREMPGYEIVELRAEMLCLVRGKIAPEEIHPIPTDLNYALLRTEVRGHAVTLLQIDISASIFKSRRRALAELTALAHEHRHENLSVLGDFNTPRESVWLDPLRAEMAHAFETAGRGTAETWPMPLPVLALDQIWTGSGLRTLHCTQGNSFLSDHRAVVADFAFAPARD